MPSLEPRPLAEEAADLSLSVRLALTGVSAAMVPLCHPPIGWWPLQFISLPMLLVAVRGGSLRRAFRLGVLHGLIGYGAALHWLTHLFGLSAIALFGLIALFTGIFCLLFNRLTEWGGPVLFQVLGAATLWTGIEFYRSELFVLRFPWITPGTALGPSLLSPLVGTYGVSFLIVVACAGFGFRRSRPWGALLAATLVALGAVPRGPVSPARDDAIRVAIVQSESSRLPVYAGLTRQVADAEPDLIIWPEYALPFDVRKDPESFSVLTNLCDEVSAILIVGTQTNPDEMGNRWYNTALVVDALGTVGETYKSRPVHFFADGMPGPGGSAIETLHGRMGNPICFDCDYTEVVRRLVAEGAEFLIVPSFDAAHWSAAQHLQHARLFRLRAAETGRWLACAASSGVSQIIDPHGRVQARLPLFEEGVLTGRIGREAHRTPFTRVGWLFPWLCLLGTIAIALSLSVGKVHRYWVWLSARFHVH